MSTEKLIFTERPYAAVLDNEQIGKRCANCFGSGPQFPCEQQCQFANYCNEKCSSEDWPWHQFECAGFLKCRQENRTARVESRCRIVARLIARFRQDKGIASLSDGFPSFAKDRKYGDLLSHYHELKKEPSSLKRMKSLWSQFSEFFGSTGLKDTSQKTFRIFFCTFRINSFSVTNSTDTLGLGLYLNASRFNHSCNPTASAKFKQGSIQIWAAKHVHPDEYNTEDRFNRLTIDYGTGTNSFRGYYLTLAKERVKSLKSRYFFRCLCSECVDSTAALIEERGAAKECGKCQTPYIWTKKGELQQVCKCKEPLPVTSPEEQREAMILEKKWKKLMDETAGDWQSPTTISELCEPFVERAKGLWHPTKNLRLGLVVERMAVGYAQVPTTLGLSEKDCHRRAEGFSALYGFYNNFDWGHDIARQYLKMGSIWLARRDAMAVKPKDM